VWRGSLASSAVPRDVGSFVLRLYCPACGLCLKVRLIAPEHCPRCLARRATAVELVRDPGLRAGSADIRPARSGAAADSNFAKRVTAGLRVEARSTRPSPQISAGREAIYDFSRSLALRPFERSDSLEQINREVSSGRVPGDEQHRGLRQRTSGEQQRAGSTGLLDRSQADRTADAHAGHPDSIPLVERIAATLELARVETAMDVAVLGEIHDGREVARGLAGDAESFGLQIGASVPIDDTYCERLLAGRMSNIVRDTRADERVCDLEITREARIGAYIGVPLTAFDARLYVLCCLSHEQRPSLSERDVWFLRGLSETLIATLSTPTAE
jgi:hypothetical protein